MAWSNDSRGCIDIEPVNSPYLPARRHTASLELLTSMALLLSIAIAATAVTIGIARADTLQPMQASNDSLILVLCAALLVIALMIGGLTAWRHKRSQSH